MFFINRQDWSLWNTFIFLYSTPQLKVVSQGQNEYKTHLYSKYINKDSRNILCIAQQWDTPKCQHRFNYVREYQLFSAQIKLVTKEIKLLLASSHTYLFHKIYIFRGLELSEVFFFLNSSV